MNLCACKQQKADTNHVKKQNRNRSYMRIQPLPQRASIYFGQIRQSTGGYIACVMSGNFVQRGECAIVDKWKRAEAALRCGADLVIELPLPFAVSTAEKFAAGGISLLNGLNCIDRLTFGSETGDIDLIVKTAEYLLSEKFKADIRPEIDGGTPFASARSRAAALNLGCAEILNNSNDILGVEYVKALIQSNSSIKSEAIKRHAIGHDKGSSGDFASASEVRRILRSGGDPWRFMPEAAAEILKSGYNPAILANLERAVLYKLRTMSAGDIRKLPDISEGIEYRIKAAAGNAGSIEELYSMIKSKRYSHARIRRIVLSALLGIRSAHSEKMPYIRILGMNENGRDIIGRALLPVIGGYGDAKKFGVTELYELEAAATDIYGLMTECVTPAGMEYKKKLIRL